MARSTIKTTRYIIYIYVKREREGERARDDLSRVLDDGTPYIYGYTYIGVCRCAFRITCIHFGYNPFLAT